MQGIRTLFLLAMALPLAFAQTGTVKSGGQPLPGATVRATQGDRVLTTLTDANGEFKLANMTPGAWTIDVTMFGFAAGHREVQIGTAPTKVDFTLELGAFGRGPAGRGGGFGRGGAPPQFGRAGQGVAPTQPPAAEAAAGIQPDAAQGTLAPDAAAAPVDVAALEQANAGGANESFLVNGSLSNGLQTQAGDFAPQFGPGGRFGGGAPNAAVEGGQEVPGQGGPAAGGPGGGPPGGFGGGRGGFPGGGGRGGFAGGRGPGGRGPGGRGGPPGAFIGNRRNAGRNQVRGSLFYTVRNSAVDASPFSLNGQNNTKASYAQNRFGFNLGGPLFRLQNTFFVINYNGSLLNNGTTLTTTVPTLAERAGDFSASNAILYDPTTHLPFAGNQIPLNPIAQGLLAFIPKPNQPGAVNNYRLVTTAPNDSHNLNLRVNQTLSQRDQLSVGFNWQTRDANNVQNFGFVDQSTGHGINANVSYRHNFGGGMFSNLVATFNRNTNLATPFFAYGSDIATALGIQGTSSNPINFGPPNLNFTNFGALSDGSPSQSAVYTLGFNETFAVRRGKHNWTFGGGYTRNFNNTITDANGRGTFTFTGLATSAFDAAGQPLPGTGLDFADFLIGLPQSNSIRYGSSNTYFRTYSFNVFGQDDYRVTSNLTLNLGVRYEYFAPWQEKYDRIANLDIAPGFTAVSVVTPTQPGPYTGAFPAGLINPDRNNFGPRTALAWKPWTKRSFLVRMGYGIYYNSGIYNQFIGRLSAQPPFAQSTTVNTSLLDPLTLATGLTVTPTGKTITNTFAVDRNYRSMYAQSWNFGIQSNLPGALIGEINYLGTKGTRLDIQEAPNQAPPGSALTAEQRTAIANATGFIYDTPIGNSIYHALRARLTRRFRRNLSGNIQYTFAKSIDNSSTLGGAGNTVAQNFYDLSAERGLSSFDRRHTLTANYIVQSPVGDGNGLFANQKFLRTMFEDWTLLGSVTWETGTPLTARVLGNQSDIAGTGVVGSGRAEATGLPVNSGSSFFNLAAFTLPLPGQYGNAGRNTITGPGTFSMNVSLQRTISISERVRLQFRVDANNITNHVNITGIGTVVNSLTYGAPTAAGAMRSLSATVRLNF